MKTYSLRRAALYAFIPPLMLTIAVILGAAVVSSYQEINRNDDAQMARLAEMLLVLTRHEALEGENISLTLGGPSEQARTLAPDQVAFRIWGGGQVITQSNNTSAAVAFDTGAGPAGYSTRRQDGRRWRILTRIDTDDNIIIEVAQNLSARDAVLRGVTASLLWPLIVMFPVIVLVIQWGLRRILAPLRDLSKDINARDAGNLDPVLPMRAPREVQPLVTALNSLLGRVADSLQRERDFTDNAAHELRTPLAALKVRAQVMAGQIGPKSRGRESMHELTAIVDRTVTMVDQMLTLARHRAPARTPVDVSALVRQIADEVRIDPLAAGHHLLIDLAPGLLLPVEAEAVRSLVRNLLDNAVRHTPHGSTIRLELAESGNRILLTVADDGPGIAADQRERVLRRFVRLNATTPGSGLGLAIVADICTKLGAELKLEDSLPHGLKVVIRFAHNDDVSRRSSRTASAESAFTDN